MSPEKKIPLRAITANFNLNLKAEPQYLEEILLEIKDFNVKNVNTLNADIKAQRKDDKITLTIKGSANITQQCGNTLNYLTSTLYFAINQNYKIVKNKTASTAANKIINYDYEELEEEVLEKTLDESINLQELIIEELIILINPYVTCNQSKAKEYIEEMPNNSFFNLSPPKKAKEK